MVEYEFLANCGIFWEQTLQTLAFMLGTLGFLSGLFLGWCIKECRDGTTWKEHIIQPWPVLPPKGYYPVKTCPTPAEEGECECTPKCL